MFFLGLVAGLLLGLAASILLIIYWVYPNMWERLPEKTKEKMEELVLKEELLKNKITELELSLIWKRYNSKEEE